MEEERQEQEQPQELSASERYYQNHLNRMREYNRKNKELVNQRNRDRFRKITEDPDKHEKYLEKKREEYQRRKLTQDPEKHEKYLEKKRQEYHRRKLRNQNNTSDPEQDESVESNE
jgi:hypothetical protein